MQTKPDAIKIRSLNDSLFIITEYNPICFRIPGKTIDGSQAITSFARYVYIIERFKTKMLMKNVILNPDIKYRENFLTIGNCKNMSVKLNVNNIGPSVKRVVRSKKKFKIPTKFNSVVFFILRGKNGGLPPGHDFIFVPKKIDQLKNNGGVLSYIVDVHTVLVQIMNTSSENGYLFKNNKLNII